MAYIDPEGMFGGDRMALLSDSARFAWPWFWCAGNTVGRVELSFKAFSDTVFRQFKKKPSEKQFWDWVSEFHECFLMFVYKHEEKVWGQWDASERYLPNYKTKADKRSPAPTEQDFLEWKKQYVDQRHQTVNGKCRVLSVSEKFSEESKISKISPMERRDLGVNCGEELKPLSADADGAPTTTPIALPSEDELVDVTARRMCARHPAKRRCSVNQAKKHLKVIISALPKAQRAAKLDAIDRNHEQWCQSEQWQKDDSEYAKGLHNWLKPSDALYDLQPPARAGPKKSALSPENQQKAKELGLNF